MDKGTKTFLKYFALTIWLLCAIISAAYCWNIKGNIAMDYIVAYNLIAVVVLVAKNCKKLVSVENEGSVS